MYDYWQVENMEPEEEKQIHEPPLKRRVILKPVP